MWIIQVTAWLAAAAGPQFLDSEQDRVSASDTKELAANLRAVKRAIVAKADTPREDRQVATFVRNLIDQYAC